MTKSQFKNLQQTIANTILITNICNLNKFWVGIFTGQGHINQVREWVSQWDSDKHSQWSDLGPIIKDFEI